MSCRRCADAANEDAECRELWINHRLSDSSSSMLSNLVVPSLSSTSPSSSSLRADRLTADQRSARRNAPRKRNYTTPTELDREPTILESEQKQQKKTKKKQNSPRSISVSAEGRVSSRVDSHRHMVQFQNWRPVLFFFPVVFFFTNIFDLLFCFRFVGRRQWQQHLQPIGRCAALLLLLLRPLLWRTVPINSQSHSSRPPNERLLQSAIFHSDNLGSYLPSSAQRSLVESLLGFY